MDTGSRHVNNHFRNDEYLYRRVPRCLWEDASVRVGVDAVQLPDISTGRSLYGHPEWVRFDTQHGIYYHDWGVIGFQVSAIPKAEFANGYVTFTATVCHVPEDRNYPHSEIQGAAQNAQLKTDEDVEEFNDEYEDLYLSWRMKLLRKYEIFLRPDEVVSVRTHAPRTHVPESHAV